MEEKLQHETWMKRALQLASYGRATVSPNPMVGCVLVYDNQLIGQGWHQQYGSWHAEVNAVNDAIQKGNGELLKNATAYVTLEPCAHVGKTPPCANLMIDKLLARVVVCNGDPNPLVAGQGIARMRAAGIEVIEGICEQEGHHLNRRFFTFFIQKRPYIILKWAETADGFLGTEDAQPVRISGHESNVMVHRWRSQEDAILVGTTTALHDNPKLNVRLWSGHNPLRVVIDRHLKVTQDYALYDQTQHTFIYNYLRESVMPTAPVRYENISDFYFRKINKGPEELSQILKDLYHQKVQSILVEGGRTTLQSFIDQGLWDEIRRCQGVMSLHKGIEKPHFSGRLIKTFKKESDTWSIYSNQY
jgi:diaminohydroxyphosphoribosylaminopyrimidine deaminase/5-amino-6-(5-phosphoribosylamino)uracil reductase